MMYYNNYWGMDLIWWCAWILMLVWIFAVPYNIPGQRYRKDSALGVLLKRFAAGEIGKGEYDEQKRFIESELVKQT